MKLNRTQALFLVGSIAAVGCVVENSDDGGNGQAGAGGSGGDTGGTGGTSGKSTGGSAGTAGSYTGGTSTGGVGGEGGATCSDDGAAPVMCDITGVGMGGDGAGGAPYGGAGGAGPSCEGAADLQALFCSDLWTNFKPVVANATRTCMNAETAEELCTWDATFGCAMEAMLNACPDDSADDECETIMGACPTVPPGDCHAVLNGMTQAGRDAVVSCAVESLECNLWVCAGVASPAGE